MTLYPLGSLACVGGEDGPILFAPHQLLATVRSEMPATAAWSALRRCCHLDRRVGR
jgi:hypothetical protein